MEKLGNLAYEFLKLTERMVSIDYTPLVGLYGTFLMPLHNAVAYSGML